MNCGKGIIKIFSMSEIISDLSLLVNTMSIFYRHFINYFTRDFFLQGNFEQIEVILQMKTMEDRKCYDKEYAHILLTHLFFIVLNVTDYPL